MKREYKDYLNDMHDSIEKIEKFVGSMEFSQFENDDKTIMAVVKALEIIGEAVKKIPLSIKKKYPQFPWRGMSGMRDKLVHEYFGMNIKVVWKTIKEDIPSIRPLVQKLLKSIDK